MCLCMCVCDGVHWFGVQSWLLFPVALTEDRILWTAHKVCNEYLSLFIFAGLRYFNVSSAFSLRATRTHHAVPTHAIAEGGGEGWGWWCRQVAFAPQWALFICAAQPIKESHFNRGYLNIRLQQNTTTRSGTSSLRPLALALGEADVGLREVSIAVHNIIWKILQLSSSSNPSLSLSFIWFAFYWALCSWELQPNKKQS